VTSWDGVSAAGPEEVAQWVRRATRIAALTGAGISTDSGIPDFRGPNGVWTKNPGAERMASLEHYLGSAEVRRQAWRSRRAHPVWEAKPNPGHLALVELERQGRLYGVVTQNVDGLHLAAGHDPAKVVEIHGTMHATACWSCGDRRPIEETLARLADGEEDPDCSAEVDGVRCGGILKSATISFGQNLDREDLARAQMIALGCDLMLAVGSTLSVYPAAGLVPLAQRNGARVVIINEEPTDYDDRADAVLRGSISELLPAVVGSQADEP
jgi:NAD-dependent deacetylase